MKLSEIIERLAKIADEITDDPNVEIVIDAHAEKIGYFPSIRPFEYPKILGEDRDFK